jgi:hypothetical protein
MARPVLRCTLAQLSLNFSAVSEFFLNFGLDGDETFRDSARRCLLFSYYGAGRPGDFSSTCRLCSISGVIPDAASGPFMDVTTPT